METLRNLYCPICPFTTTTLTTLEFHTESHFRVKTDSPIMKAQLHRGYNEVCPICFQEGFMSADDLERHVNNHFYDIGSSDVTYLGQNAEPSIAVTHDKTKELIQKQEEIEFKKLQTIYGFVTSRNMSQQCDASLANAVKQGRMSAAEYHERRIMLKMAEKAGADDSTSCTRDIISDLERHCRSSSGVRAVYLCSLMDHYASSIGDSGWGCGYRNVQMLLSCLLRHPGYSEHFRRFSPIQAGDSIQVPSVTRLQKTIEEAWEQGFDVQGCEQLGGKLVDTAKWIGATEVAALLASCSIRYRLIDFYRPSSDDGKCHTALVDWVVHYFKSQRDFKPPLFFQHQGHSRTIVGIEETKNFQVRLLVLDPSHKPAQMFRLREGEKESAEPPPVLKKIRLTLYSLKSKQYQIVCVDKGFVDNPQEFSDSKILRSTRIP